MKLKTIFNEAGKMDSLMKYPVITIYAAYLLGRLAGALQKVAL